MTHLKSNLIKMSREGGNTGGSPPVLSMELRKSIGHRRFLILAMVMILLSCLLFFRDYRNDLSLKKKAQWRVQELNYQKHYASYINSIMNENKALSGISIFAKKKQHRYKTQCHCQRKISSCLAYHFIF